MEILTLFQFCFHSPSVIRDTSVIYLLVERKGESEILRIYFNRPFHPVPIFFSMHIAFKIPSVIPLFYHCCLQDIVLTGLGQFDHELTPCIMLVLTKGKLNATDSPTRRISHCGILSWKTILAWLLRIYELYL